VQRRQRDPFGPDDDGDDVGAGDHGDFEHDHDGCCDHDLAAGDGAPRAGGARDGPA
jgi:hypothetical protein